MNTEEVQVMLCIDRIVWDKLVSVLDAHPEESLYDPASPRWTSRDVYAHITRWLNHSNELIETYCTGKKTPSLEGTAEEINSRWQREDSRMSLNDVRERARKAFTRRLRSIEAIPVNLWDEELEKIVRYDGATHYALHLNYIVVTPK